MVVNGLAWYLAEMRGARPDFERWAATGAIGVAASIVALVLSGCLPVYLLRPVGGGPAGVARAVGVEPVSYTHLDVYKRQHQAHRAR